MATVSTRLVTAEEFFDFTSRPDNHGRLFELEAAKIVEFPVSGAGHDAICENLALIFSRYVSQMKRGCVLPNRSGLVLARGSDSVRAPDLAVYADHTEYANSFRPATSSIMPTLVVEVAASDDKFHRLMRRLNDFLDKGVELVWLVEPKARSVTVWWEHHAPIVFDDGEFIENLPALPYFHCEVTDIFDEPIPRADIPMILKTNF